MSVEWVIFPSLWLFALVKLEQFAISPAGFMVKSHDPTELIFGFACDEIDFLGGFAVVHASVV